MGRSGSEIGPALKRSDDLLRVRWRRAASGRSASSRAGSRIRARAQGAAYSAHSRPPSLRAGLLLLEASLGVVISVVCRPASAQLPEPPSVTLTGIVSDSIRGSSLAGAFVSLVGPAAGRRVRSTASDQYGRFRFDSVVPGIYVLSIQHSAFDSLGLSGISRQIRVTDGRDTVRLSLPSFEQLWKFECGGPTPASDSGFVFGTVRSAVNRRPVAASTVSIRWTALRADATLGVEARQWREDVRTDSLGEFRACGVPLSGLLQVRAQREALAEQPAVESGLVMMEPNDSHIRRIDLVVGPQDAGTSLSVPARGVINGVVATSLGIPIVGAAVATDDGLAARSDSTGHFWISEVRAGTRQLEARYVGMAPLALRVDVYAGDTARIAVTMVGLTTLSPMRIISNPSFRQRTAEGYESRRSLGFGDFRDSVELSKHATLTSVLREIPGVKAGSSFGRGIQGISFPDSKGTGRCAPSIWIDGKLSDPNQTVDIGTEDLAAVEVYTRPLSAPGQFIDRRNQDLCGAIVFWTKRAFP